MNAHSKKKNKDKSCEIMLGWQAWEESREQNRWGKKQAKVADRRVKARSEYFKLVFVFGQKEEKQPLQMFRPWLMSISSVPSGVYRTGVLQQPSVTDQNIHPHLKHISTHVLESKTIFTERLYTLKNTKGLRNYSGLNKHLRILRVCMWQHFPTWTRQHAAKMAAYDIRKCNSAH